MNCLLGITIQCARCHEHKFEPIAHDEFYRLEAIFYPAYNPERWTPPKDRIVTIATAAQRAEHKRRTDQIDRQVKALQESLGNITASVRDPIMEERLKSLPTAERAEVLKAVNTPEDKRSREQKALLEKHKDAVTVSENELIKRFPEFAAVREQIIKAVAAREKERPKPLEALSVFVETDPNPPAHHLLLRGQHNEPGPEVQPGVPVAFCTTNNMYRVDPRPSGRVTTGRRTAFARWVTSPENPLFARVMVNRIWQHHFGVGLVATPDNLGQSGAKPSHPELLDYLATEFIRSDWSIKAMHRLIVRSAVYRQTSSIADYGLRIADSKTNPQSAIRNPQSIDPDNRLLSHYPLRRLDAESLRDSMMAISGELDRHAGGPFVHTERNAEGSVIIKEDQPGAHRRSVYLQQRRTQVLTMLELFDAPSIVSTCGARTSSTIPLQSLALLNSDFARRRATAFAC